ncbi:MAG: AAA family ATPase, partial [Chloroflexi bacterium]|nr:AAA family ATPase [Chloroflexota bacterium]
DPATNNARIVILSARTDVEDVVTSLEAGADDYIAKSPKAVEQLRDKIQYLLRQPVAAEAKPQLGRVISFLAAKGGIGTTSICVNLAHAFGALVGANRLVVVDMVLPLGSVGLSMGIRSGESILPVLAERQTMLNPETVRHYVYKPDRWNLQLLLSPSRLHEAQAVEVTQIVPLFNTLRTMFDYIFVDFGRSLSRISLPILRDSQCIVLILAADRTTIDQTHTYVEYLTSPEVGIPRERFVLVYNRAVGRAGLDLPEIEARLGLPAAASVPYSEDCFTDASNRGRPLAELFPYHVSGLALKELAERLEKQLA